MSPPRVALVGLGGYGRVHARHLREFHQRGEIVLAAAVAFPPEREAEETARVRALGGEIFPDFEQFVAALPRLRLGLVVVPTPIHLHARMTIALVRAGVDVLVEKPLAATPEDCAAVAAAARETGRVVAVGFQYLHAPEIRALKARLLAGAIGPLRRLVVHAAWPRSHAYYSRNAWAGRLRVGGDWVFDSPVSNAMSHFLMVMLYLAGDPLDVLAEPAHLRAELYRAQPIESFDTAVLRLQTAGGLQLDFYGTHSSRAIGRPTLQITGDTGSAEWVQDQVARCEGPAGLWEHAAAPEADTRERMLRTVLAHRQDRRVMITTPEMAALHVRCIAEIHRTAAITAIPERFISRHESQGENFTFVPGLDDLLWRAAQSGQTLAEAGAPWLGSSAR